MDSANNIIFNNTLIITYLNNIVIMTFQCLKDVSKDFERNMDDMVTSFREFNQGMMTQGRDLENMHHERLLEIAISVLEKVVKNELDDEISDDLREVSNHNIKKLPQ